MKYLIGALGSVVLLGSFMYSTSRTVEPRFEGVVPGTNVHAVVESRTRSGKSPSSDGIGIYLRSDDGSWAEIRDHKGNYRIDNQDTRRGTMSDTTLSAVLQELSQAPKIKRRTRLSPL